MSDLTPEEQAELKALREEQGDLSPEEMAELNALRAEQEDDSFDPEAALQGFGQAATFGTLPYIAGAASRGLEEILAPYGMGPEASRQRLEEELGVEIPKETTEERAKDIASEVHRLSEESPWSYGIGSAPGYLIPGMAAGKVVKGVQAARAAKAAKATPAGKQMMLKGVEQFAGAKKWQDRAKALGTGTAIASSESFLETHPEDVMRGEPLALESRGARAVIGGTFAGGLGITWPMVKGVTKATGKGFIGVSSDVMENYVKNRELINSIKNTKDARQKLETELAEITQPVFDEVKEKGMSLEKAQDELKRIRAFIENQFDVDRKDAEIIFKDTEKQLKLAYRAAAEDLDVNNIPPTDLVPEITKSIRELKKNMRIKSKESEDILLKNVKEPIQVDELREIFKDEIISMHNIMDTGEIIPWPGKKAAIDFLKKWEHVIEVELALNGGAIPPNKVKQFLRQMDDDINWAQTKPELRDPVNKALKRARNFLRKKAGDADTTGQFNDKMSELVPLSSLMDEVESLFQRKTETATEWKFKDILKLIHRDSNIREKEVIGELGKVTGQDFEGKINLYIQENDRIKNILRQPESASGKEFKASLPEWKTHEDARVALERFQRSIDDEMRDIVQDDARYIEANQAKMEADIDYREAKDRADALAYFNRSNPENRVNALINTFSQGYKTGSELRKHFTQLGNLTNFDFEDFIQRAKNIHTEEQFQAVAEKGRQYSFFTMIGSLGIGLASSGGDWSVGAKAAIPAAVLSGIVNQYGADAAKGLCRAAGATKGLWTKSKIKNWDIDEGLKTELLTQWDFAYGRGISGVTQVLIPPEDIEQTTKDIKAMDLSNTDKAKMIAGLNEKGVLVMPHKFFGTPDSVDDARKKAQGE